MAKLSDGPASKAFDAMSEMMQRIGDNMTAEERERWVSVMRGLIPLMQREG